MANDLLSAKLPRDFAPRRFAQRRAVFSAAPTDGIKLRADEHGGFGLGHTGDAGAGEQVAKRQRIYSQRALAWPRW